MIKKLTVLGLSMAVLLTSCFACAPRYPQLDPKNPVQLTLWLYYPGATLANFNFLVDQFNTGEGSEKGVNITATSFSKIDELNAALKEGAEDRPGKTLPSMYTAYSDTVYELDELDKVADLSPYFSDSELEEYVEGYIEEGRFGGDDTLKIFPTAKCTELLFLNETDWKPFARAKGVTEADLGTLEGLTAVSQKYYEYTRDRDGTPVGKAFFGRDALANYFLAGSKQLGKDFFRVDEQGRGSLNADDAILKKLWENYYVPYVKGYFTSGSGFSSNQLKDESIIAYVGSGSSAGYFPSKVGAVNDETQQREIEGGVYAAPVFSGGEKVAIQQGAGVAVTKSDQKTEYACAIFLKWFTQRQNNMVFAKNASYLPVKAEASSVASIESFIKNADMSAVEKQSLIVSARTVEDSEMYTSKPFEKGYEARGVLEKFTKEMAVTDHEAFVRLLESGVTFEAACAQLLGDSAFQTWLNAFKQALSAYVTVT